MSEQLIVDSITKLEQDLFIAKRLLADYRYFMGSLATTTDGHKMPRTRPHGGVRKAILDAIATLPPGEFTSLDVKAALEKAGDGMLMKTISQNLCHIYDCRLIKRVSSGGSGNGRAVYYKDATQESGQQPPA